MLTRKTDRDRALSLPILHIPGGTSNGLAASVAFQCKCVFCIITTNVKTNKKKFSEPFSSRGVFCKEMALMLASSRPRYRPLRLYCVETEKNGYLPMFMTMNWGLMADIGIILFVFNKKFNITLNIFLDLGSERFRWAGMIRLHIEAFIRIARTCTLSLFLFFI